METSLQRIVHLAATDTTFRNQLRLNPMVAVAALDIILDEEECYGLNMLVAQLKPTEATQSHTWLSGLFVPPDEQSWWLFEFSLHPALPQA